MMCYPLLLPCSFLLSCLPSVHPSPCQEVVDSSGSIYGVEQQMGADSHTCLKDSFVFTMEGRRFCFTEQQAIGSVATDVRCKGAPPSAQPSTLPYNTTSVSQSISSYTESE